MRHTFTALLLAGNLVFGSAPSGSVQSIAWASEPSCTISGGLATLRDQLGAERVGECVEDEHVDEQGNIRQRTTRGQLLWVPALGSARFLGERESWTNGRLGLRAPVSTVPSESVGARPGSLPAVDVLSRALLTVDDLAAGWTPHTWAEVTPEAPACEVARYQSSPAAAGDASVAFFHPRGQWMTQSVTALPPGGGAAALAYLQANMTPCSNETFKDPLANIERTVTLVPSPLHLPTLGDELFVTRMAVSGVEGATDASQPQQVEVLLMRQGDIVTTITAGAFEPGAITSRELATIAALADEKIRTVIGGQPPRDLDQTLLHLDVEDGLVAPWRRLLDLHAPNGEHLGADYARIARDTGVRMEFGVGMGAIGDHWSSKNRIRVTERLWGEDDRVLAAILAHELTHARQGLTRDVETWRENPHGHCIDVEVEAFRAEARAWSILRQQAGEPLTSGYARTLDGLLSVVGLNDEAKLRDYVMYGRGYDRTCRRGT